jgi:hypothetical protein
MYFMLQGMKSGDQHWLALSGLPDQQKLPYYRSLLSGGGAVAAAVTAHGAYEGSQQLYMAATLTRNLHVPKATNVQCT